MLFNSLFSARPMYTTSTPFSELDLLRRQMDAFFDQGAASGRVAGWPQANLSKKEGGYTLTLAMPGLKTADLEIKTVGDELTITGQRAADLPEGYKVLRSERRPVQFMRRFRLPRQIDTENITASMADGILTLTLPIREGHKPRTIAIQS